MKTTFLRREDITPLISSFSFAKPEGYAYTAGQFTELRIPGRTSTRRWFTLSSSPTEEVLTITTRIPQQDPSAFKKALDALQPGDEVDVAEAMGDFVLPKLLQTPLVFVAGGIGITPFRSQLEWLAATGEERPIQLVYGVRTEEDIIFQESFDAAHQHAVIVVGQPSGAWGGERGQITGEMLIGLTEPSDDTLFYVSGPEPFVQAMHKQLQAQGIAGSNIVHDEFQGYEEL